MKRMASSRWTTGGGGGGGADGNCSDVGFNERGDLAVDDRGTTYVARQYGQHLNQTTVFAIWANGTIRWSVLLDYTVEQPLLLAPKDGGATNMLLVTMGWLTVALDAYGGWVAKMRRRRKC